MGFGKLAEVTVIVPARMGSTRLPGKPLADVSGKPLIVRVLEGVGSPFGTQPVVATDNSEIARVVEKHGFAAILTGEAISGTHRVHQAWKALGSPGGRIVNLQGDEPCATPEWITALLSAADQGVTTLASPTEASAARNPSSVKVVVDQRSRAIYFSRSPIPWGEGGFLVHTGAYCFTPESLKACVEAGETILSRRERLEQLAWIEKGVAITVATGNWSSLGVDTPEDLERARRYFGGD